MNIQPMPIETNVAAHAPDDAAPALFPPYEAFARQANASDADIYARAGADPNAFWAEWARELTWSKPFTEVLDWNPPHARWFWDGHLNASVNCVDRHLNTRGDKPALVWEGEPGDTRTLTYRDLAREVGKFANVLQSLGVQKGDRISLYMPMVPEAVVAMLACARLGAPHSVVFGGFSSEALRERTVNCGAKIIITADGYWRRGGIVPLKQTTDGAAANCPDVQKVIVLKRIGDAANITMQAGRDLWWHDLMADAREDCPPAETNAEDPLFILYTSGSTGKPKGVLHTTGGYLTGAYATTKLVFDIKDTDLYWCTADVGWITGHSYVVYGPLSNGATVFLYEGSPDWGTKGEGDRGRLWDMIERHKITILYTAPTLVRSCMKWGDEYPAAHDLSSLRLLGSVGEPINPEAWLWYHKHIGNAQCPIVDTWWQTETGAILISPLPGLTVTQPGSATRPFPGIEADVVDERGQSVEDGTSGILVIRKPWPSMLRTLWGNDEQYKNVYWSKFPGLYFPGDGAMRDKDGNFWLLGRVDDVLLVSGHNISTMELESALVEHPAVAEAAVIGKTDAIKGQVPVAFVIVREGHAPHSDDKAALTTLVAELKAIVVNRFGAFCRPDDVIITEDLVKTRSGKIVRRVLRDIAENRVMGDITTLADPSVIASLKAKYASEED